MDNRIAIAGFPVNTLVTLIGLIFLGGVAWAKVDSDNAATNRKIDTTTIILNEKIDDKTKDRITRTTVTQMFDVRDVQITAIVDDVKEIKDGQKENQKLLQQILREMPRKTN